MHSVQNCKFGLGIGRGKGWGDRTGKQALSNTLGTGEGQGACLPVDGGVVLVQPREAHDDWTVSQSGDIQSNGFCVVASGSELGWKIAGDGARRWRAAIDEFYRDRLGMGVGREVVVCQDLRVDEVAGCPGVDQHPDRSGWEGVP